MRILALFAGGFSAGIFLCQYLLPGEWILPGAFGCLLLGCLALLLPIEWRKRGVLVCSALALALGYHWLYCYAVQRPMEACVGTEQTVTMTLTDYASPTKYGAKVTVSVEGLPAKAVYYGEEALLELRPGQTVTDTVRFQNAARIRDDDVTTFTSKGVFLLAYEGGEAVYGAGSFRSPRWWPARLGHAMQQQIAALFDGDTAGFLTAILTGNKSVLSEQAGNDLSESGIYHILAVSGMHCSYLLALVIFLLGRHRRRLVACSTIVLLIGYAMLTGGSPSIVRACIMLSMVVAAPLFRRDSDGPTSLLTALFLILLANPFAAASISLQLSFTAMAGILWLTPKLYSWFTESRGLGKTAYFVAASLSATLGALVFSWPVSVYYFGFLVLISPLSNLVCLWAAGIVFCMGLAAVLLSFLWMPFGMLLGVIPAILTKYILFAAHPLAKIPYHAVYLVNPYLKYWLVLFYVLIAVAYLGKGKRRWTISLASAVLTLVVTVVLGAARFDGDLETVMLDVGQGQSIVLASEDVCALVDCGSANSWYGAGSDAADYLLTMGYGHLDYLLLTHYDSDHINGVEQLLARMPVERVYLPDSEDKDGLKTELLEVLKLFDTEVSFLAEQEEISLGQAKLTLFPPIGAAEDNEQGISVLASLGKQDLLITGDMNRATEKQLLNTYDLPDLEVLAAGHHGSKSATSAELLDALTPETVCISVGSNSYGHPAEEMLRRLGERECAVYRTDLHGNIRISWNEGDQHGKESNQK